MLLQSDTSSCLDCISLFHPVLKYTKMSSWTDYFGPRPARPILARGRGGQRRRSAHPPRWDRSNQWNQQREETTKKILKNNEKVQQTLCDKHLSAKLTDYLPSMEQQEDGHRGSHNLLFSPNALYFIRFIKCLPFFSTQNQNKITKSGCLDR